MTPITPISQPPIESLRNALQIAECYRDTLAPGGVEPFLDIARLIRDALDKLSEPHPATVSVAGILLHQWLVGPPQELERMVRDFAAAVTKTALDWNTQLGGLR